MNRLLAAALTAAALLWAAAIVGAPSALRHPVLAPPAALVYVGASRFCHQRPERSFSLGGGQMPVCARCAGLYLSAAAGLVLAWIPPVFPIAARRSYERRPGWPRMARGMLLMAAAPTLVTWTLEVAGVLAFSNLARALAALPLGIVAGWLFVRMLRYDSRLNGDKIFGR